MHKYKRQHISIIIPTLNEEKNLGFLLHYIKQNFNSCEIIVVDGGSSDKTVEIAQEFATVVFSPKGRGKQLNAGAKNATGDILWFLHADTTPHIESIKLIQSNMLDKNIVGGGFAYNLGSTSMALKFISWFSNQKNRLLKRIYGDMGIFVRREIFNKIDGFPESLLMEDFEFSRRLKRIGKILILPQQIKTSPRDWYKEGFTKKVIKDTCIRMAYCMNVDDQKLYNWYYGVKR